ncbi:MAG TPA: hypothetical protein VGM82_23715 [Gemmatimonadaceae bacterium]|jgi:opacity protein-like surface antigen
MPIARRAIILAAVFAALHAIQSHAQTSSELRGRSTFGLSVIQTRPQGELARNIGFGYGLNGSYLFRLDRAGVLSLRADVGVVDYGDESKRSALSETIGDRVQVDVRTTNYIVPLSIGPQLTWPTGAFRPYVNAGVGGQAYFTESDVEGTGNLSSFANTTNQSDFAASWIAGGGVYAPIVAGKWNVQLDLGLEYFGGGTARYLGRGSITDLSGGQVSVSSMQSDTHVVVVHLGARVGF